MKADDKCRYCGKTRAAMYEDQMGMLCGNNPDGSFMHNFEPKPLSGDKLEK